MALKVHRRLARQFGYDLQKTSKQMQLTSHLRYLFELLKIEVVLDVGANAGQYAKLLRREVGFAGEIHSFEPLPAAFDRLYAASHSDSRWFAYNFGLDTAEQLVNFKVANQSEFTSMHASNDMGEARFLTKIATRQSMCLPVRRLDEVVDTLIPHICSTPTFLKMDTQGHDRWVFTGAGDYAAQFAGLQSELSVVGIYEDTPDYIDMLKLYRGCGYELTGAYTVNRHRNGQIVELDCIFARDLGQS